MPFGCSSFPRFTWSAAHDNRTRNQRSAGKVAAVCHRVGADAATGGGASVWTAVLGLGIWAPVLQFGIAAIQTAVLFTLFMRLKGGPSLKWVFAITGFFWLLFLYGLSTADYSNRQNWPPAPISGTGPRSHQGPQNRS
jgi:caa(3)-type oxidase subunit IV